MKHNRTWKLHLLATFTCSTSKWNCQSIKSTTHTPQNSCCKLSQTLRTILMLFVSEYASCSCCLHDLFIGAVNYNCLSDTVYVCTVLEIAKVLCKHESVRNLTNDNLFSIILSQLCLKRLHSSTWALDLGTNPASWLLNCCIWIAGCFDHLMSHVLETGD